MTRGPGSADPNFPNGNALASLTDNRFNNWQLGFRLNVPLGTREAHAAVRVARLNLARSYAQSQGRQNQDEADLQSPDDRDDRGRDDD